MNSFLHDLASKILAKQSTEGLTLVFPNRRAVLYFQQHLGSMLKQPMFAPSMFTIEDFVSKMSRLHVPDRLELVHTLYEVYSEVMSGSPDTDGREPFDQFYFWGEMLLRDFDEVDKYMVDARQLFRDLSNLKELDSGFEFLTEEQRNYLKTFWGSFSGDLKDNKRKFLRVWKMLSGVYEKYREQLLSDGRAYDGLLQRTVVEGIKETGPWKGKLVFAGFNALTLVEERLISHFVSEEGAEVYWDLDAYYVNNQAQEAGRYFREYQRHPVLKSTFPADVPANFSKPRKVRILGSAQHVGQAKLLASLLESELKSGVDPENTLVVLPDEKMLLPVLHSISGQVNALNVTMGFPLAATPIFNLIEFLVELQQNVRKEKFNHSHVVSILSHPYIVSADASHAYYERKQIIDQNQISLSAEALTKKAPTLYSVLFKPLAKENILSYLHEALLAIGSIESLTRLDKEYVFEALQLVNRLSQIMGTAPVEESKRKESLKSFSRLFRQLGKTQKIPFTGEPLAGLQIMGVLETRNLDFKNVFIMSLNEGSLPASGSKASYIPRTIRQAYALPTTEHQDAMYAYLFYRVLQRAENVFLFYNTEPDILGQGEWSRFLQQLILESGWNVKPEILHTPLKPHPVPPIVIQKDERIQKMLARLNEGTMHSKGISPSALNMYIDCSLKFYFRYVARLKEPEEVEDAVDARLFGNLLHKVLEKFYRNIQLKKKGPLIQPDDFKQSSKVVDKLIEGTIREEFKLEANTTYGGNMLVVREVIRGFAEAVLKHDLVYAPFTIEGLERDEMLYTTTIAHAPGRAVLNGKIDRIDSKDGVVRILDYKTGKTENNFKDVNDLFTQRKDRPSAVFQTLLYALIYRANNQTAGKSLVPGLVSRNNLFEEEFRPHLLLDKEELTDASVILDDFEARLNEVVTEIFDPGKPFFQTEITETCKFCPYKAICYR